MKIYVVGSSKNKFLKLDHIREKFIIDENHKNDNIDFLNPWYCELTGLYYAWKNCNDDIIGLEHYRRYFTNKFGKLLCENEIIDILNKYDIIAYYDKSYLPINGGFFKKQNEINLAKICAKETLENEELGKCIYNYLITPGTYMFNMFICKKEIFNKIAEQLFTILSNEPIIQNIKRSHGYISEMLLGSLFSYNNLKVYNASFKFIK